MLIVHAVHMENIDGMMVGWLNAGAKCKASISEKSLFFIHFVVVVVVVCPTTFSGFFVVAVLI